MVQEEVGEMGEEVCRLKHGLSGELFLKKNHTLGKQWLPLFSARLPGHSLQLFTASSSVRKLLPATHGLPKNGLCKLIPEGEWQRVPAGRGAASAGAGAGAGHHHSIPDLPQNMSVAPSPPKNLAADIANLLQG